MLWKAIEHNDTLLVEILFINIHKKYSVEKTINQEDADDEKIN